MRVFVWATVLAICASVAYAWFAWWVSDDAFISYRYAQNLAEGHGLVYNVGLAAQEGPVEGYTNFLWTILITLGMKAGVDPIQVSNWLGIVFHAGTLLLLLRAGLKLRGAVVLPIAALGYALHDHAAQFATSGLETSMFVFLTTAAIVTLIEAQKDGHFLRAGMLLILATMTRPDGALFYMACGMIVLVVARGSRRFKPLLLYSLPFLVIYLPYYAWRFAYYGFPLPNTFYAKSASEPYLGQGVFYLTLYVHVYLILVSGALGLFWALRQRDKSAVATPGWESRRAPMLLTLVVAFYGAYVIWVGGDFMFSRFALPMTPALFLALQLIVPGLGLWQVKRVALLCVVVVITTTVCLWARDLLSPSFARHGVLAAGAGLLVLVAAVVNKRPAQSAPAFLLSGLVLLLNGLAFTVVVAEPQGEYAKYYGRSGIADERRWYPASFVAGSRAIGEQVANAIQEGTDVRVAITGTQAMLAYYARFPTVIECHGLTDKEIAHRDKGQRGLVGHERLISPRDPYLKKRRVHFMFDTLMAKHLELSGDRIGARRHATFEIKGVPSIPAGWGAKLTILYYDREVMAKLRKNPRFHIPSFEDFLDGYLKTIGSRSKDQVRRDYAAFEDFYFGGNQDAARKQAFEEFLSG